MVLRSELVFRGFYWLVVRMTHHICNAPAAAPAAPAAHSSCPALTLALVTCTSHPHHTEPSVLLQNKVVRPSVVPLRLRLLLTSLLHHRGGIHSGCAVSAVAWLLLILVDQLTWQQHSARHAAVQPLSWVLFALLAMICVLALPGVRRKYHDVFEMSHRFLGWTALAVLLVLDTVAHTHAADSVAGYFDQMVRRAAFWLELVITVVIVLPWLTVMRVPVTVDVPVAKKAAIVHLFCGAVPAGFFAHVSRKRYALGCYHAFAGAIHFC